MHVVYTPISESVVPFMILGITSGSHATTSANPHIYKNTFPPLVIEAHPDHSIFFICMNIPKILHANNARYSKNN